MSSNIGETLKVNIFKGAQQVTANNIAVSFK